MTTNKELISDTLSNPDKMVMITPELCLTAVQEDSLVLGLIPEEFKTPELCLRSGQEKQPGSLACAGKIKDRRTMPCCSEEKRRYAQACAGRA